MGYKLGDLEFFKNYKREQAKIKKEIVIEGYILREFENNNCNKKFYKNLDEAIFYYEASTCDHKKLYIKLKEQKPINISQKPNLKYTMNQDIYKKYGTVICYHTTYHDSEKNGTCFDEDFSNDFIDAYKTWKNGKDGIDYLKFWIEIEGIGSVLIGSGTAK